MKILFIIMFLSITCLSQRVISIEQQTEFRANQNFPSTVREVRDLNNSLDKFLGSWVGEYKNYRYELTVTVEDYYNSYTSITTDNLNIKFVIRNSSGAVLLTSDVSNKSSDMVWIGINERGEHEFSMKDSCSGGITAMMEPSYLNGGEVINVENPDRLGFYFYTGRVGGLEYEPATTGPCDGMSKYFPILGKANQLFTVKRP
ncbi:hypothetical protein [Nonlabens antarcticus]|uniref:hypothetical protein n=1 Tax=Nonlabens antarcticus TaxID=392714 RepID=UPI001891035A|nr:hypothetical protein [Nonlabens antarcticus]